MVISFLRRYQSSDFRRCDRAGGDQRRQIAPAVSRFHEVHAVPLKGLFDDELAAHAFVEGARGLVARDDPGQETRGPVLALRVRDGADQSPAEAHALEFAPQVDGRQLGIEAVLRRLQPVAGAEADDVRTMLRDEHARGVRTGGEHAVPERRARLDLHAVEIGVRDHAAVRRAPAVDAHAGDGGRIAGGGAADGDCADRSTHATHATRFTVATTFSTVKLKCLNSTGAGADSP